MSDFRMYTLCFNVIYLFFSQTLECINRFNVIVLGACVRACALIFFTALCIYAKMFRLG